MKCNEVMIIRNEKLIYAVSLQEQAKESSRRNTSYIYTNNGKVVFADGWIEHHEFDFSNESHQLAKEIFVMELQTDIKRRILELKQLQNIFAELNLSECFGSVLVDNTKLLLEVRDEVAQVTSVIETVAKKEDVEAAIVESVAPVALSKGAKKKRAEQKAEESKPVEIDQFNRGEGEKG